MKVDSSGTTFVKGRVEIFSPEVFVDTSRLSAKKYDPTLTTNHETMGTGVGQPWLDIPLNQPYAARLLLPSLSSAAYSRGARYPSRACTRLVL